jgi:hypothetical protein
MRLLLLVILLINTTAFASTCLNSRDCAGKFFYQDHFLKIHANFKLDSIPSRISKAIIVVHGTLRNGDEYFDDMITAARLRNKENDTLIISPSFKRTDDEHEDNEYQWGTRWYQKWKYGYVSQNGQGVSSYQLIDQMIKSISSQGITEVVITGHSAGGQFTQRYAVASKISQTVKTTFAPSNPSSYMYLSNHRYNGVNGVFNRVQAGENCEEYNHYIYGPVDRAEYLAKYSISQLESNFSNQSVVYLMGAADNEQDYLDKSCEANLQGIDRYTRSLNFYYYVNKHLKSNNHLFHSIANVGHDHLKIFQAKVSLDLFFGQQNL